MLDQLSARLQKALKFLRGEGKITEKNLNEALRMIRLAFLEADVNYKVVKEFEAQVKVKALNERVLESLTPAQQVIKIVRDELTQILGSSRQKLLTAPSPPTIYLLVGLQGVGKTTTTAKLSLLLKKEGKSPLLVSFDLKRPAAQEQLKILGAQLRIEVFGLTPADFQDPAAATQKILNYVRQHHFDYLLVDTAGRLHIDQELMDELKLVKSLFQPTEVIYVGDALTGQDAVRSAQEFERQIGLDSIILTKLDGDARGGAALSITYITGKPIKYIGVGEKSDQLEPFHPERMASRILGMGDVLSLIEKAEQAADRQQAEELARRIKRQEFRLEDFRQQLVQLRKMGSFSQILSLLPTGGMFKHLQKINLDDKRLIHFEAIINSMTPQERENPKIINGSRRRRIALGSGRPVSEVNQLLKQYFEMRKLMKKSHFKKMLSKLPLS
ncbi:MAG: signal recognition particle protein [Candidatus Aminicenantes bacterium]|nr:signal recognition particle protein [Candidatus Aminicenantes bacterium]